MDKAYIITFVHYACRIESLIAKCRRYVQWVDGEAFRRGLLSGILHLSAAWWHVLRQGLAYAELSVCFLFPGAVGRKSLFIVARLLWSLVLKGKGQRNGYFSCDICILVNLQAWGTVLQLFQTCLWIPQFRLSLRELPHESKSVLGLVTPGPCRKALLCWRALLGN